MNTWRLGMRVLLGAILLVAFLAGQPVQADDGDLGFMATYGTAPAGWQVVFDGVTYAQATSAQCNRLHLQRLYPFDNRKDGIAAVCVNAIYQCELWPERCQRGTATVFNGQPAYRFVETDARSDFSTEYGEFIWVKVIGDWTAQINVGVRFTANPEQDQTQRRLNADEMKAVHTQAIQEAQGIVAGIRLVPHGKTTPTARPRTTATKPAASAAVAAGCKATIDLPSGLRPGDTLSPSATVTGSDGKTPQGAYSYVWYLNGVETSSIVWDGKRVKVELQLSCENTAQALHASYPAYGAPPGLSGIGAIPGPESLPQGIIGIMLPGLISIIGGALAGIAGGGRPAAPPQGTPSPGRAPSALLPGTPGIASPGGPRPAPPPAPAGVSSPEDRPRSADSSKDNVPEPEGGIEKVSKGLDDTFGKIDEIGGWHDNLKTAIENLPISPGLRDKLDKLNDVMDKTRELGDSLKDAWETVKDPLGLAGAKEKLDAIKKTYEDLRNSYDEHKEKNKDQPSGVGNRVAGVQSIIETAGGAAGDYISEHVSEGLGKDVSQAGKDAAKTVRGITDWNLGSEKYDKDLDEQDKMSDRQTSVWETEEGKQIDRDEKARQAKEKPGNSYWGKAWKWLYPEVKPGVEKFR